MIDEFGFLIAVCATSAICYALVTRADRMSDRLVARRRSGGDGSDTGSDNWTLASWFSGGHSASCDNSGNPLDFGSCGSAAMAAVPVAAGVAETAAAVSETTRTSRETASNLI